MDQLCVQNPSSRKKKRQKVFIDDEETEIKWKNKFVSISKNPLGLAPILTLCYAIATPLYK